nr:MAG TPA: hypothetical protein [Caudoviricetes sp.]
MYYLATKVLGLSEQEFYMSTPKKLFKLVAIHQKVNNPNPQEEAKQQQNEEECYIDQL